VITASQRDLFGTAGLPEGFVYRPDFLSTAEEATLLAHMPDLDFQPFDFHGYQGKRRVIYFGWRYDFTAGKLGQADPIPDFLLPLRDKAAAFAGLKPDAFGHVLVNEYQPGAPIGWHRDRPQFEDVVGVSLGAPGKFRFRHKAGSGWDRTALTVAPRSVYLLRGPARTEWEHSLPPAPALRYSITFRSLRPGAVAPLQA
jgi:alkylated DNA repair dioxygenase AlkB